MVNGKQKGAKFERDIAKLFGELANCDFDRSFRSGGGKQKGDIIPVNAGWPFIVELKNRESWSFDQLLTGSGEVFNWWEKLKEEAEDARALPMLVFKKNRKPTMIALCSLGVALFKLGENRTRTPNSTTKPAITRLRHNSNVNFFLLDEFITHIGPKGFANLIKSSNNE